MKLKSILIRPFAKNIAAHIDREAANPIYFQEMIFKKLVHFGKDTLYGKERGFSEIKTYQDFKRCVPINDYEDLRPYIDRIKHGELDILWKDKPIYFAKTSGTTSGIKYIPMSRESVPFHFGTARNALFYYMAKTKNYEFMDGKMIFLSGSPELSYMAGIPTGRLSGISNHLIPSWLRLSQLPSYETNCIEDWETKLEAIVRETVRQDMRLISGIPPWVQMYYERLLEYTGKTTIKEIFPNFSMYVYGGVNFEPYRAQLEKLVGERISSVETYPASEGFIGFQDRQNDIGLLLNINAGIFYEFIPENEFFNENPTRLRLQEVEIGVNYALLLNTNAGLWGYSIGDMVQFIEKNPYRIIVSGRIKHFISAFGEHVIGKEVEAALMKIAQEENIRIIEFTVAPQVNPPANESPYHEWLIEFDELPKDLNSFSKKVDAEMQKQNIYYQDLIAGNILQTLKIRPLKRDAFRNYMKRNGKLGGQNKVPRLSNDRKIADDLCKLDSI